MGVWGEPDRVVAHLHMGSWKPQAFQRKGRLLVVGEGLAAALLNAPPGAQLRSQLFPVSTVSHPSFTVMTFLKGQHTQQV